MDKGSGSLAQSFLRKEINDLQKKFEAIKAQQKQEEKVKEKMEAESRLKLRQIQRLQDEIRWLQERHAQYVNRGCNYYTILNISLCRSKAELTQQSSDIEKYWLETLNDIRTEQKRLIIELAESDEIIRENQQLKDRYESDLQQYRVSLLEYSMFLNRRTEYNFDMTIKFDQIMREFVTLLYLEENQSKAVSIIDLSFLRITGFQLSSLKEEAMRAHADLEAFHKRSIDAAKEGVALTKLEYRLRERVSAARIEVWWDAPLS